MITGCTMPISKTGEARGTGYQPSCGDNMINQPGEECDGPDLGGKTCEDVGDYTRGTLSCTAACKFDLTQCSGEITQIAQDTFSVDVDVTPHPELTSSAKVECFPKGWILVSASHGGEWIEEGCTECGPDFECIQWIAMEDPELAAMTGLSTGDTEVSYIVIKTNDNEGFSDQDITVQGCGDGVCNGNEDCNNCPADCPRIPVGTDDYRCAD